MSLNSLFFGAIIELSQRKYGVARLWQENKKYLPFYICVAHDRIIQIGVYREASVRKIRGCRGMVASKIADY